MNAINLGGAKVLGHMRSGSGGLAAAQTIQQIATAVNYAGTGIIPPTTNTVMVQALAQKVGVTADGVTAPSATIGLVLDVENPVLVSQNWHKLQFITLTAGGFVEIVFMQT